MYVRIEFSDGALAPRLGPRLPKLSRMLACRVPCRRARKCRSACARVGDRLVRTTRIRLRAARFEDGPRAQHRAAANTGRPRSDRGLGRRRRSRERQDLRDAIPGDPPDATAPPAHRGRKTDKAARPAPRAASTRHDAVNHDGSSEHGRCGVGDHERNVIGRRAREIENAAVRLGRHG